MNDVKKIVAELKIFWLCLLTVFVVASLHYLGVSVPKITLPAFANLQTVQVQTQ